MLSFLAVIDDSVPVLIPDHGPSASIVSGPRAMTLAVSPPQTGWQSPMLTKDILLLVKKDVSESKGQIKTISPLSWSGVLLLRL